MDSFCFAKWAFKNNGGNNRARTYDPLLVRQMLSQLSYASVWFVLFVVCVSLADGYYYITPDLICQYLFESFFDFFQSFFRERF